MSLKLLHKWGRFDAIEFIVTWRRPLFNVEDVSESRFAYCSFPTTVTLNILVVKKKISALASRRKQFLGTNNYCDVLPSAWKPVYFVFFLSKGLAKVMLTLAKCFKRQWSSLSVVDLLARYPSERAVGKRGKKQCEARSQINCCFEGKNLMSFFTKEAASYIIFETRRIKRFLEALTYRRAGNHYFAGTMRTIVCASNK